MFDNHEPPPDRWDRVIRFALGFAVGTVSGVLYLRSWERLGNYTLLLALGEGLLLGFLAAQYGDRAWRWFVDRWQ